MKEKSKKQEFFLDIFLRSYGKKIKNQIGGFQVAEEEKMERFYSVCNQVKIALDLQFSKLSDWEKSKEKDIQRDAIIGERYAVKKLLVDIRGALIGLNLLAEDYPAYYRTIEDGIFQELFGLAGLAPWANDDTEEYARSSSAKIIGDHLYCMIDGRAVLQPQKIPFERREQIRHGLLLKYTQERKETGHNEVYLMREDGNLIRTTLMNGRYTYPDQDVLVFRKYLLSNPENLTFENLASLGTFPKDCCAMFKAMVNCGWNVFFMGQVRSGKTTFLQTWQHYEDSTLEGTTVSSDEETDFSKITEGPLVQIIADEKNLDQIEKSLKRLDSNYIIMSEVRTPAEYRFFLGITNMGTRRCKCTIHDNSATNFPYKMATEITTAYGGNQEATISQLYSNIDFVFELGELPYNRAQKRLVGIVELRYDPILDLCSAHRICQYNAETDSWTWKCDIGEDKKRVATGGDEPWELFYSCLKTLEETSPIRGENVVYPSYFGGNAKKRNTESVLNRIAKVLEQIQEDGQWGRREEKKTI